MRDAALWVPCVATRRRQPVHCLSWLDPKARAGRHGASSIAVTLNVYTHLFEDKAADRDSMKKIEAAIAAA
jgi:hypothetical protein